MKIAKKIVLLGHFGVGKTSIIRQFVSNEFSSDYKVTIGVHILKKEVVINDTEVSLIIWDIEGTDNINLINKAYLMGSHSFIFTYDITRPATFLSLTDQIELLKQQHPETSFKIIGNKVDLISTIDTQNDEYIKILEKTNYLTSAKTGENIDQLFSELALEFLS